MLSLAFRNVLRHAAHSLLLASLFALVSLLFVLGNSLLSHSNRSLRDLYVSTVTGDYVVAASSEVSMSIFGANTPAIGEYVPIPTIPRREEIADSLAGLSETHAVAPILSGAAVMDAAGVRLTVPFFGVEPESYFRVVRGLEIVAGRAIAPGERGAMITAEQAARMRAESDTGPAVSDELLFTTGSGQRFRIQGVPLVGIFRYPRSMDYVDEIALVDATTARALNDIQARVVSDSSSAEGPSDPADLDALFSDPAPAPGASERATGETERGLSADDVLERVREGRDEAAPAASGAAHFLLVRGERSEGAEEIAARYGVEILSWREAAGQAALLAVLLQGLFNAGFVLFVFAVTLGVVNIVLISVFRRTREIGTLRAIGIEDGTVRGLLLTEHAIVAVAGWFVGVLGSIGVSAAVRGMRVRLGNRLIAVVLGGETVSLPIDPMTVGLCLVVVAAIVAIAVVLPANRAVRTPIVEAVREG
ncbi:MAG: ABC transporter permease [Spirochaetota bacterium]